MWLRVLTELATVLPNSSKNLKILPYRTTKTVHAIYVREMEVQRNCHWMHEEGAQYDAIGGSKWDSGPLALQNIPPPGQNIPLPEKNYRYGNDLLGLKGTLPEEKGIACFTYFMEVWYADPIAGLARCRAFMPFAKCDKCVTFRAQDLECTDQLEKKQLRTLQATHLREVTVERSAYYRNRLRGITDPEDYLSMIIDGANQAQHAVPHSAEKSHISDAAWKMQLHLMGVIVHGRGTWAYTCPPHVAQGNNTTIQALWDTICDIYQKEGKLPKTLYLQLDNTTKQCKGRYVFGFLGLLVYMAVFDKVIVGFLPVGHTHEDIDQFFSRIAMFMRKHGAMTREEFGVCVQNSYTKNGMSPIVRHWDSVANISDWMKSRIGDMSGLMGYRHFKITHVRRKTGELEIRWMCRNSPGSVDPKDGWRGPGELSTHVDVFPNSVPDLLADASAGEMPPCKRSTANKNKDTFTTMLKKVYAGLDSLLASLPAFRQVHYNSCKALADLVATPLDVPIPFNWNLTDIAALTNYRAGEDVAAEEQEQRVEYHFPHRVGEFVLIRPSEDDPQPFYLAKIVEKLWENGHQAVRLCYYEHEHDNAFNGDPYTGCYEPSKAHFGKPRSIQPLLTIYDSSLQAVVPMKSAQSGFGGGYRVQISERGLKVVRYWVHKFTCGNEYEVADDD